MSEQYEEYLHSEHWREISAEARRLADHRCQVCNSDDTLHVHHRTYERKGHELQADLIVLCKDCHALFHGKSEPERDFMPF